MAVLLPIGHLKTRLWLLATIITNIPLSLSYFPCSRDNRGWRSVGLSSICSDKTGKFLKFCYGLGLDHLNTRRGRCLRATFRSLVVETTITNSTLPLSYLPHEGVVYGVPEMYWVTGIESTFLLCCRQYWHVPLSHTVPHTMMMTALLPASQRACFLDI